MKNVYNVYSSPPPVVRSENSSHTDWKGSGIRVSLRIHFTRCVLGFFGEPSHSSRRSLVHNLPEKVEIGTWGRLENTPDPLDPDFHTLVVKTPKTIFGGILGQKGPKMGWIWAVRGERFNPEKSRKTEKSRGTKRSEKKSRKAEKSPLKLKIWEFW